MKLYAKSFSILPGVEIHDSNSGESTEGTTPEAEASTADDDDSMAATGFFLDGRILAITYREK